MTEQTINTTAVHNQRTGELEIHLPGCKHLSRQALTHAVNTDRPVERLREFHAEAKEIGAKSPIAPCLRSSIR